MRGKVELPKMSSDIAQTITKCASTNNECAYFPPSSLGIDVGRAIVSFLLLVQTTKRPVLKLTTGLTDLRYKNIESL